jgi:ribosomal protein S18 acetylase RimI-like enzyme
VRIRDGSVEDAGAIARVQVASWRDAFRGLLPDDYLDVIVDEDDRAGYWAETLAALPEGAAVLVAEEGDDVVGFVHAGPGKEAADGELSAMHVVPALRRRGIGFDLHDAALRRLRRAGFSDAELWLLRGNDAAQRFYERQGWHADGTDRHGFPPTGAIELRYVRPL